MLAIILSIHANILWPEEGISRYDETFSPCTEVPDEP